VAVSVGVTVDGVVVTGTVSVGAGVSGVTGGVSVVTTGVFVGVTGVSVGTVVAGTVSVGVMVVGTGVVGVGVVGGWMTGSINCRKTNRHNKSNSVTSRTSSRTRKTLDVLLQRSLKELIDIPPPGYMADPTGALWRSICLVYHNNMVYVNAWRGEHVTRNQRNVKNSVTKMQEEFAFQRELLLVRAPGR